MPNIRKVPSSEGASWTDTSLPSPTRKKGITRMDYPQHGSVGWTARVYTNGLTFSRYFADEAHGGPEAALKLAEEWRDQQYQHLDPPPPAPAQIRIVRVDKPQQNLVGWYVYTYSSGKRIRRYVSDIAHGGSLEARRIGKQWAEEQINRK